MSNIKMNFFSIYGPHINQYHTIDSNQSFQLNPQIENRILELIRYIINQESRSNTSEDDRSNMNLSNNTNLNIPTTTTNTETTNTGTTNINMNSSTTQTNNNDNNTQHRIFNFSQGNNIFDNLTRTTFQLPVLSEFRLHQNSLSISDLNNVSTIMTYSSLNISEDTICVICHNEIEENNIVRKLNNCSHFFHIRCLDTWLSRSTTCPVCRNNLLDSNLYSLQDGNQQEEFINVNETIVNDNIQIHNSTLENNEEEPFNTTTTISFPIYYRNS